MKVYVRNKTNKEKTGKALGKNPLGSIIPGTLVNQPTSEPEQQGTEAVCRHQTLGTIKPREAELAAQEWRNNSEGGEQQVIDLEKGN